MVVLSDQCRVTIPKHICERLSLRPGRLMKLIAYQNRIELIPVEPLEHARGFLKGIDTSL
ncbi:MAG TPA: AbrB/MazE/SpoVT family DNA-binding domain-containing protein, partial [Bacteroidetes bacterium]|nr:AbrB/MazE/SpoVT family DNA-binding domain-containing protein [Bacteroidota bacterium]